MEIHINSHRFKKVNLVTLSDRKGTYDLYKCEDCGLEGKRRGFTNYISVNTQKEACPKKVKTKSVFITDSYPMQEFGFKKDVAYETVESPQAKYKNDVWVYSEKRKEPVRLLPHEYKFA